MLLRIAVTDDNSTPVTGATVVLYTYDPNEVGAVAGTVVTEADGLADFDVDEATYAAAVRPPSTLYLGVGPRKVVHADAPQTVAVELARIPLGTPPTSTHCRVYFVALAQDLRKIAQGSLYVHPSSTVIAGDALLPRQDIWPTAGASGSFYFDLIRGASLWFHGIGDSPELLTIPDEPAASLIDLLVKAPLRAIPAETEVSVDVDATESVVLDLAYFGRFWPTTEDLGRLSIAYSDSTLFSAVLNPDTSALDITGLVVGVGTVTLSRATPTLPSGVELQAFRGGTITVSVV